ncbi:MAG TPA: hypothetical protein VGO93_02350 [Candidatus Xenobia bacterium]|jgi:hypothetical protein
MLPVGSPVGTSATERPTLGPAAAQEPHEHKKGGSHAGLATSLGKLF